MKSVVSMLALTVKTVTTKILRAKLMMMKTGWEETVMDLRKMGNMMGWESHRSLIRWEIPIQVFLDRQK